MKVKIGKLRIYLTYSPKYKWSNVDQQFKIVKRNWGLKIFGGI
jgi:hypothetical protein